MSAEATRMQDLASEFSKIFRGNTPGPPQREGRPPPAPTPSPASGRARGASAPVFGPKPWSPQLFSRGCAPVIIIIKMLITGTPSRQKLLHATVETHKQHVYKHKYFFSTCVMSLHSLLKSRLTVHHVLKQRAQLRMLGFMHVAHFLDVTFYYYTVDHCCQ